MNNPVLKNKIALVAGGTRGAGRGIATELGAAGAIVYVTGRTTRAQRSEYNRSETIEETAELVIVILVLKTCSFGKHFPNPRNQAPKEGGSVLVCLKERSPHR